VLTSDENDLFLEQLLISITSLRMRMPDAVIIVLTDDITASTLTGRRSTLYSIAEVKTLILPSDLNKMRRSRWLKTTMRRHVDGDFLYIDCDTIVSADLSDIKSLKIDLGAVPDQHTRVSEHQLKKRFYDLDKTLGFSSAVDTDIQFNGGVLLCRDVSVVYDFFEEWHKLWIHSISQNINVDQPSLNQAGINSGGIIAEIDGKWNCQIEFSGLFYLSEAKIIHYFTSKRNRKPFVPADDFFMKSIKQTGQISQEIKDRLENPLKLFDSDIRLISDKRMLSIIDSPFFDYILLRTFNKNGKSAFLDIANNFIYTTRKVKGNLAESFDRRFKSLKRDKN
jgi:lipopolysaccharide biosynthesis glycosyltransferase